jgi:hypothetical protein
MKPVSGKKTDYIHIRSDQELKTALERAAKAADRTIADQARYLLRIALGLREPEPPPIIARPLPRRAGGGEEHPSPKRRDRPSGRA